MKQDVIQVPFGGVAASKLHGLFERGYTVCGVAIQRTTQNSNFDRGAITTGGMVMWWRPEQHKSELHRLHEENQTLHEKNGLLKYALTAYEKPKEQGHGAAPAPQNLYQITGNVADVNTVLIERAELHRLQAENDGLRALASGGIDLFERYSTFKAKCEELEAMLDAVGAGGVGQSIKPKVQADTSQEPGTGIPASVPTGWKLVPVEPTDDMFIEGMEADCRGRPSIDDDNHVRSILRAMLSSAPDAPPPPAAQQSPAAWAIYSDDGTAIRLWSRDKATAQDAANKFGLPLVPLYTAPQPTRQPLTDEKLYALYCEAMKGYYVSALHYWRETEAHKFARAIEAAVANQPPPRQPLTVETFTKLAHRMATKYTHRSDPSFAGYAFLPHTLEQFVRAIEAAHGITESQP